MPETGDLPGDLRVILADIDGLERTQLDELIAQICVLVDEYRVERRHRTETAPRLAVFTKWYKQTLSRLEDLESWLENDPMDVSPNYDGNLYERVAAERIRFTKELNAFKIELQWLYDPRKGPGRPVDWVRADLEEGIGTALFLVGVRPTEALDGVFARVLRDAVYPAVGLSCEVEKAVRVAVERHREWHGSAPPSKPPQLRA